MSPPIGNETYKRYLFELLDAIAAVSAKVRESVEAERYVEARAWLGKLPDLVESADEHAGALAYSETRPVLGDAEP